MRRWTHNSNNRTTNRRWNNATAMSQLKAQIYFKIIKLLKKRKLYLNPYITAHIKTRNYLSNISYTGVNKEDFHNKNFAFDVYVLMTKNLNPFLMDWKLSDQNKYEMIYMLWKQCIPSDFYKFICREEHFLYLNGKKNLYPNIAEIVWKFIAEDDKNFNKLRNSLCQFKEIFRYVSTIVYPEIYCTTERRGFDLQSTFQLILKTYKDKKRRTAR